MLSPDRQRQIAEHILGYPIADDGCAPCPGAQYHSTQSGARDWRLYLANNPGETPREHCFHQSCLAARTEFMRQFLSALRAEEHAQTPGAWQAPRAHHNGTPPPQHHNAPARPEIDLELAARLAAQCPRDITPADLLAISPIRISDDPADWPKQLIDTLYQPGERILIFTASCSQGQYLRVAGKDTYTLSCRPGVHARPGAQLPRTNPAGMWYLCAPVLGTWHPNPQRKDQNGHPLPGRRHSACCTRFPYAVLESDAIPPAQWLRILVQLHDPIAAVYTSGGKSIHALIRVDAPTKDAFDIARKNLIARLAPIGADPAAITAVRLTRLPGCIRAEKPAPGNLQTLLYLNPHSRPGNPLINRL